MQTETQPQEIVLFEPNHEQSWPSFHVVDYLLEPFVEFLHRHDIDLVHPEAPLGNLGPNGLPLFEIQIAEDHSVEELEAILSSFYEQQSE